MCSPSYFLLEVIRSPEVTNRYSNAKQSQQFPSFIRPTLRTDLPALPYYEKLFALSSAAAAISGRKQHDKRSLRYDKTGGSAALHYELGAGGAGSSPLHFNSNFEFVSNWTLTEEEEESATEMSDEKLRSLGFPVPQTTEPPVTGYHGGGSGMNHHGQDSHIPVIDNPFIQFLSRKYGWKKMLCILTIILNLIRTLLFQKISKRK